MATDPQTLTALLETRALSVTVGHCCVCQDCSLTIKAGEFWGILGANGVGKTTLLHTLAGLRQTSGGKILLAGTPQHSLRRRHVAQRLGLLPQDSNDAFPATVYETALTGRHPHLRAWGHESRDDFAHVAAALAELDLTALAQRPVQTLSGGERRRLAIATLLVQDTPLSLLDEPLNHLDLHHQVQVLELLQRRSQSGARAVVMTLHDINMASRYCNHIMLLFGDGEWQAGTAAELLSTDTLERLYDHPLTRVAGDGRAVFLPR